MNYQRVYDQICDRGKTREKVDGVYYEQHHITPRCMGGDDSPENLVNLTAREHFICHWLLARIYPTNRSLVYTLWLMCSCKSRGQKRYVPSSRIYQEAKEFRTRLGHSDNTKQKIRDTKKGCKSSEETKQKMRLSHLGVKRQSPSEETKNKIRQGNKGKTISQESIQNWKKSRKSNLERKRSISG